MLHAFVQFSLQPRNGIFLPSSLCKTVKRQLAVRKIINGLVCALFFPVPIHTVHANTPVSASGRDFLFMGDNTTTYVFRGRELERMEGSFTAPAPETLEPLPPSAVYDPNAVLPAQLKEKLQSRIGEFEKSNPYRFFLVVVSESDFEDYAWRLLDTIRFGTHSGNEVVLVFSSGSKRSTVLFGPSLLIRFDRNRLTKLSTDAVPTDASLAFADHVTAHLNSLLQKLGGFENKPADSDSAKKLLFGGQSEAAVDNSSAKANPATTLAASSGDAPRVENREVRIDNQAWRTVSLVLICVLIPSLIIGGAILLSTLSRQRRRRHAEGVPRVDVKPLGNVNRFPERRVKSEEKPPEPLNPVPRQPQRAPTSAAQEVPQNLAAPDEGNIGAASFAGGAIRLRPQSRPTAPITFAPGEEEKIGELLAALKLLQDADADITLELLELVRSLLRELKEIAASAEFAEVSSEKNS